MSRSRQEIATEQGGLDISSLIDVCFLLLIYFMVTATIQPRESDIGVQFPSGGVGAAVEQSMLISVQEDGSILLNQDEALDLAAAGPERALPQLQQRLEIYKAGTDASGSDAIVQLKAANEAPQQAVIDVLNCLAGLEIRNIAFTDIH